MNIFVLDLDPDIAAKQHCDKHVVKMLLESCQMLSAALPYFDSSKVPPYKPTHINHPCSVWVRASQANYNWLYRLFCALNKEYTNRYGKVHKCAQYTDLLNLPAVGAMTDFAQAMPDEYKDKDVVKAYRSYYIGEKASIAKWKNKEPDWWVN